uniref:Strictosidine synthase conserved region domain-containing protein n=1 Tax=Oryza rufipogon TaxID=4529 RepID=A0A0E0REV4_ORYRU
MEMFERSGCSTSGPAAGEWRALTVNPFSLPRLLVLHRHPLRALPPWPFSATAAHPTSSPITPRTPMGYRPRRCWPSTPWLIRRSSRCMRCVGRGGGVCSPEKKLVVPESVCGRPLGLQFHHASGDLYVADAPPEGAGAQRAGREVVTTEAAGVPFNFLNGLDIDQRTSDIYFTDSSSTYWRRYPKLNQSSNIPTPQNTVSVLDLPMDPFQQNVSPALPPKPKRRAGKVILMDLERRRSASINKLSDGFMSPDPNLGVGKPRGKDRAKSTKKLKMLAQESGILLSLNPLPLELNDPNASDDEIDAPLADCSIRLLQQIGTEVCGMNREMVSAKALTAHAGTGSHPAAAS